MLWLKKKKSMWIAGLFAFEQCERFSIMVKWRMKEKKHTHTIYQQRRRRRPKRRNLFTSKLSLANFLTFSPIFIDFHSFTIVCCCFSVCLFVIIFLFRFQFVGLIVCAVCFFWVFCFGAGIRSFHERLPWRFFPFRTCEEDVKQKREKERDVQKND